jgi:predicted metal-dependent hydrolase
MLFGNLFQREAPGGGEETLELSTGGRTLAIRLIRHPRARRYTLRVRDARRDIVLTIPRRGTLREARAFAERNLAWIERRLDALPETIPFADGAILPVRGVPHRIVHKPGMRGTVWRETGAFGETVLCVAGAKGHVARRVGDFLRREAKGALTEASRRHAAAIGVTFRKIALRDSATRWGSCSESGSLCYSWRLILAPPYVLDYLAAHEVAHRIELNHSVRFWRLLDRMTPDRRRAEAWLSAQGAALHRYGKSRAELAADAEQPLDQPEVDAAVGLPLRRR